MTLKDVARTAGVSTATVSRVLNQPASVRPVTRARVEDAITRLRYHPNRVARRLRAKEQGTYLLGLLIPDIQNPFFAGIARGVEDVAFEHKHALIVCNSDDQPRKEDFYLQLMHSESVDGIILPKIDVHGATLQRLIQDEKAIIYVDHMPIGLETDMVLSSNKQAGFDATDYLIRQGHRRVGLLSGAISGTDPEGEPGYLRMQGYRRALDAHGIAFAPELVRSEPWLFDINARIGQAALATHSLLDQPSPPTALFACSITTTLGMLEAVHARGLEIPEDLSVIGFDDFPAIRAFKIPLTIIRQPMYEMGRRAALLLLDRIRFPERPPVKIVLKTELVIRQSVQARLSR